MITSRSIVGASETASVFLVFLVFLGLGYTQRQDGHVSMEAVQSRLSPRTQAVSRVLTLLICFCMSVLLIYGTAGEAWNSYVTGEYQFGTVRYPFWPMKFGITWGFILLALQQLVDLARAIQALRHHAPPLVVAEPGA
jgi:TRAP-type C4-dicarboxylate transport system permease small subunit